MANTLKFGNENWATKKDSILAYNDENANFKPLPFTTSRASTATRVNKAGLLETVASGVPRVDYLGNTKGAYLLEPQSSNLIAQSEAFTNPYWTKSGASIQGDASTVGSEQVVNGDFATTSNWVLAGESVISGGRGIVYSSAGAFSNIKQLGILTVGKNYILKFDILTETSGYIKIGSSNGGSDITANVSSVGSYTYHFNAVDTLISFARGGSITHIYIDNVSIKEVQGFASPSADSPLGAFKLVEDASTGIHRIYRGNISVIDSEVYSTFIYAKKGERNFIQLLFGSTGFGNTHCNFDLNTGEIGTPSGCSAKIEVLSNGFYKCSITATSILTTNSSAIIVLPVTSLTSARQESYAGDGTSGVYIFGAQLEKKSYATSYIPNFGTALGVTRLADTASQTIPDGIIGQTEGTVFLDFKPQTLEATSRYLSIENSSSVGNGWMGVFASLIDGNIRFRFYGDGWDFNTDIFIERDTRYKIAFSYKNGVQTSAYINGNLMQNLTASLNGKSYQKIRLSEAAFGVRGDAHFKDLRVYNTALTDAELAKLTTI